MKSQLGGALKAPAKIQFSLMFRIACDRLQYCIDLVVSIVNIMIAWYLIGYLNICDTVSFQRAVDVDVNVLLMCSILLLEIIKIWSLHDSVIFIQVQYTIFFAILVRVTEPLALSSEWIS